MKVAIQHGAPLIVPLLIVSILLFANDAFAYTSQYEVPFILESCDEALPDVQIIQQASDWQFINDPNKRVFCVEPGDYTSVGRILFTQDGSNTAPRYLILNQPTTHFSELTEHPVRQAIADRAIIDSFTVTANYWVFDRITVLGNGTVISGECHVAGDYNIFNRMLWENTWRWALYLFNGSDNNTIQHSLARNPVPLGDSAGFGATDNTGSSTSGIGAAGVTGEYHSNNNRWVSNEVVNYADGFQLVVSPNSPGAGLQDFSGTIIDDNDFYVTPDLYRNEMGNLDPSGGFACTENGVDIKSGGKGFGINERITITNNRIWGIRRVHPSACPSNSSAGVAIASSAGGVSASNDYFYIAGNAIWNVPRGIQIGFPDESTGHVIKNNFITDSVKASTVNEESALALSWRNLDSSGIGVDVQNNAISDFDIWSADGSYDPEVNMGGARDFQCNYVRNTSRKAVISPQATADNNAYFVDDIMANQITQQGLNDITLSVNDAYFDDACFETQQISNPAITCVPSAIPSEQTPRVQSCPPFSIPILIEAQSVPVMALWMKILLLLGICSVVNFRLRKGDGGII